MKRLLATVVLAATALLAGAGAAAAATPSGNVDLGTQYGTLLRAKFAEHFDGSGYWIAVYGSSNCTATLADNDYLQNVMPSSWNDAVSSIADYNYCDVNIARDTYMGTPRGYVNYGYPLVYVGGTWNDQTSSFALS